MRLRMSVSLQCSDYHLAPHLLSNEFTQLTLYLTPTSDLKRNEAWGLIWRPLTEMAFISERLRLLRALVSDYFKGLAVLF